MQSYNSKVVVKAIENETVVWFEEANNYLMMKSPAYAVLVLLQGGMSEKKVIKWFSLKYHQTLTEAQNFVTEVKEVISEQRIKKNAPIKDDDLTCLNSNIKYRYCRTYLFKNMVFNFYYETILIESMFHPLLQHLEIECGPEGIDYYFFTFDDLFVLKCEDKIIGRWKLNDAHYFKGKVFMEFLNKVYKKHEKDWMCVLHASAVCNGSQCLLFVGDSGSGKSTLAAILQKEGYNVLADDFVPIEARSGRVIHFPAAISVKDSAQEILSSFYPELLQDSAIYHTSSNKSVKYLAPVAKGTDNKLGSEVKAIVCVKYDKNVDFSFKRHSQSDAFKMLIPDSWLSPDHDNVKRFLDWFGEIPCYKMHYSNNKKMVAVVNSLF